jgi:DNA-binding response OmpR family regulator
MEAASHREVLVIGDLEIRPDDGLAVAAGRALTLSVREFGVLCALARRAGGIVRRDELHREVWGSELRRGDRSVDVYVHKLRVKLEAALPDRSCIHTHVGFGYRFEPERRSQPLHIAETSRQQAP